MKLPRFRLLSAAFLLFCLFNTIQLQAEELGASISADNKNIQVRGDLRNLKHRLEVDKKCHVAFLGGSITQNGSGHTAMVPAWLKHLHCHGEQSEAIQNQSFHY